MSVSRLFWVPGLAVAPARWAAPRRHVRGALAANAPLALAGLSLLLTAAAVLAGLVLDPKVIVGAPGWLKPAKFAFSFGVYALTLLWLLGHVQGHPRLVRWVSALTAVGVVLEQIPVIIQVARGTTSHFNVGTPFDAALYGVMAASIIVVWAMNLLAIGLLLRQRLPDPAYAWGLRLGLVLTSVGFAQGLLMTNFPTADQQAVMSAGGRLVTFGGHAVGVPESSQGLPLFGWSTGGGDLRVGHFFGIHALQAMPLLGWLLARGRVASALGPVHRAALVWTGALAYLGLMLLLTWQALRGQSVVAPDAATLAGLGLLAAATTLTTLAIVVHGRRRPPVAAVRAA